MSPTLIDLRSNVMGSSRQRRLIQAWSDPEDALSGRNSYGRLAEVGNGAPLGEGSCDLRTPRIWATGGACLQRGHRHMLQVREPLCHGT